ncbi:hypothetical protein [Candidatus Amarolinea dominans]|uniref:hypothetical protein n=1 Tax=Candidatus Amarolinea dominans TaxID=3140696 RepID=UPI003135EA76|nr:hypothetical protein [Anaerolineae bacterium]
MTTTTNFGKYQTIEHLGSGGQAEVYLALEPRLQRRVAIKVLLAHLAHDPEASARFAREARLVASLRPAIVQLFDFDTQDDQFLHGDGVSGGRLTQRASGPARRALCASRGCDPAAPWARRSITPTQGLSIVTSSPATSSSHVTGRP